MPSKMIYYLSCSFFGSCSSKNSNKLLKMRIRLLHDGQPTTRAQVLLPQPSSPIRRSITTVRQLSWLSNPTSIDLFHFFRMVLARHVMNRLFASIDSTHPAASSAAAIVPNVQLRLNGRQVYRLLYEEEDRDYIRMIRMIRTMTVRAPPPARLASFGLRSNKRG